jgi:hypothetical protein
MDLREIYFIFFRLGHLWHMMQAVWFRCDIGMNNMERGVAEQNQYLDLSSELQEDWAQLAELVKEKKQEAAEVQ